MHVSVGYSRRNWRCNLDVTQSLTQLHVAQTYRELKSDYAPYANFDAFRNRRVYGCNTSRISFYEEVPFHPELLLKDLVKVFHPDILKDYTPRYFTNLAE